MEFDIGLGWIEFNRSCWAFVELCTLLHALLVVLEFLSYISVSAFDHFWLDAGVLL